MMLSLSLSLLILLLMLLSSSLSFRLIKKSNHHHHPSLSLHALKDGAMNEINRLKVEYNNNSNNYDSNRLKEMKVILECVKALEEIDRDLELFEQHLNGDDDKLKETASVFKKEFEICKNEIESQLNKLL